MIVTTAIGTFIILIVIGIVVGLVFNRYGRSWLGRQVAGATGAGDITYALVGIAGSFMGFHIGVILGLLPSILLYVAAILGAAVTLWLWRGR
ncbi:transglycosylase [Hyphomicrobium sp.]|uniref:transglycosylase n=1 Tax=Hyphomicrobium sp. TaxID=82 RepID=UPI003F702835